MTFFDGTTEEKVIPPNNQPTRKSSKKVKYLQIKGSTDKYYIKSGDGNLLYWHKNKDRVIYEVSSPHYYGYKKR